MDAIEGLTQFPCFTLTLEIHRFQLYLNLFNFSFKTHQYLTAKYFINHTFCNDVFVIRLRMMMMDITTWMALT